MENNSFSQLSLEQLKAKESEFKKRQPFLVGIAVVLTLFTMYSIFKKKSGFLTAIAPLIGIFILSNNGSKLKRVQDEIQSRNSKTE